MTEQTFSHWQLCLVEDSTSHEVRKILAWWARREPRITLSSSSRDAGLVAALNSALSMAEGDFVMSLRQGDLLHRDALGAINHAVVAHPEADVVYADEDFLDGLGLPRETRHKPPWSPEYLEGFMYLGRFTAYRTDIVRSVGGWREATAGSEDWDLALRTTRVARAVRHIPQVLYHSSVPQPSAAIDAKERSAAPANARAVIEAHVVRTYGRGTVEDTVVPGWYVVRPELPTRPRVTAVIPTAGSTMEVEGRPRRLVDTCLDALFATTDYPELDAFVVVSGNAPAGLEDELESRHPGRVRTVRVEGPFNYSTSINAGVLRTDSPYVLLLNDDTKPATADWLLRLVECAAKPGVGVVGAKLLYPDGRVQHAGVTHGPDGLPHHPHLGHEDGPGRFGDLVLTKNYLAVTGACQLVRRDVFHEVGGYDPTFPLNYNDVDFCLRTVARGYRVVQQNASRLVHYESASRRRGVHTSEIHLFHERWAHMTLPDPYWSAP